MNAERIFRQEAASLKEGPPDMPLTGAEERAVFEDVLLYNVADGDPERYTQEFDRLAAWADNSLDMYKVRCGVSNVCRRLVEASHNDYSIVGQPFA